MIALRHEEQEDVFVEANQAYDDLIGFLRDPKTREIDHAGLESEITSRGRELERKLYQAHIDSRGSGEAASSVCGADGVERRVKHLHERGLTTVFGEVRVSRYGYRAEGVKSIHPLDTELNLPVEEYSLGVRRMAVNSAAQVSFDATVETIGERTGKLVGKRQVEEIVGRAAVDFDTFYTQNVPDPDAPCSEILVISADGKGVVMRPEDLREATRQGAQAKKNKLEKRLSRGEKGNRKRMATVAAVYTVAPYERTPEQVARTLAPLHEVEKIRPKVENKRVWASLEKTPEEVLEEAFQEGLRRDLGRQKKWVGLVDGNLHQLKLLDKLSRKHQVEITVVMDIMHVSEYLWDASTEFHEEASKKREQWVTERLARVLCGQAGQVAAGIRRSATRRKLLGKKRENADKAAKYLLNHKQYMRYDEYLAKGYPIASGVIEGACRHLVCDRMDTVARWSLKGAEAVLKVRALRSSSDLDAYWEHHMEQEYQRNHVEQYANGKVIPVKGRLRPVLEQVK
jgi:hypothetical protein